MNAQPTSLTDPREARHEQSGIFRRPDTSAEFRRDLSELVPTLQRRALRLCRNRNEAEDVVHDAIERALRFESTYQRGTNLRAWVNQILFSVFVSRCRKTRRERNAIGHLTDDPCAWTRKDQAPEMQSLTPRLQSAIDELPTQFGAVVQLVDLDDHSYREAAEALSIPVGTVMSRLYRGRRLLAQALAPAA